MFWTVRTDEPDIENRSELAMMVRRKSGARGIKRPGGMETATAIGTKRDEENECQKRIMPPKILALTSLRREANDEKETLLKHPPRMRIHLPGPTGPIAVGLAQTIPFLRRGIPTAELIGRVVRQASDQVTGSPRRRWRITSTIVTAPQWTPYNMISLH